MSPADSPSSSRKLVYALLIVVAAGSGAGRIASASRVYEPELTWPAARPRPMPTFSSNDRSRWATVRALVDEGTYVIGRRDAKPVIPSAVSLLAASDPIQGSTLAVCGYQVRTTADTGIIFEDGWQSVDKILNPTTLEYYSTKPPLLSTLVAGLYWLLQTLFGWTLTTNPFAVVRTVLVVVNLIPFVIYLVLLARCVEQYGATDWGRFFVFGAGCFATLVTLFLITLNNHTIATCCVLFALYPVLPLLKLPWDQTANRWNPSPWAFAASGLFASFTVCNELPALAFAAVLFALLVLRAPRPTLLYFVPAAVIPLAGLLVTNYIALGELNPAYSKFGGPWYEYEGSHWRKPPEGQVKHGIDWAWMHESRGTYALHVLVGHHGLFSLSPIWLMAVAGMAWAVRRVSNQQARWEPRCRELTAVALSTLVLTVVVVGFYLVESNNYGGWTSGLRWLMWLTPLWLLTMLPVADAMGRIRWGRWVAYGLLAWSVFSVSYTAWNPWRHPWLYNLLESGGYIAY